MTKGTRGNPIDDISYLARSDHRIPTLVALSARPRSRSELWEMAGVSASTIRRTLTEFEERGWIRKDEYKYEATQTGSFVGSAMVDMIDRIETEQLLREVWEWLPDEDSGFTLEMCTDATITLAEAENPYSPVNRFTDLLQETEELRFVGLDVAMFEPCKDDLCRQIIEGMESEIINPPRVARYIRETCAEEFSAALETGRLSVRLHDDLPSYGVCIVDERVAVTAYDPDSRSVRVLVDTDGADAREWAESVYRSYRRQTPILPLDPSETEEESSINR